MFHGNRVADGKEPFLVVVFLLIISSFFLNHRHNPFLFYRKQTEGVEYSGSGGKGVP